MKVHRVRGQAEYETVLRRESAGRERHRLQLEAWSADKTESFKVPGYSYPAGKHVDFLVDFQHAGTDGSVNWRERVLCPITSFNLNSAVEARTLLGNWPQRRPREGGDPWYVYEMPVFLG